ncbi:alpha/beta hydrolase [Frankia sp. Cas4]|uniref:alpha/beta fold hydrolase n=1 Tax=Frankia sp. Cas4 TaxID=3073927 RepID=UPI002AD3C2DB|nr:alpha/beta hydrolase [Frankia sp. Cas4]
MTADIELPEYDEFGFFEENAAEAGLAWAGPPLVRRENVDVGGERISALVWGDGPAELVFLHGGAQNAHTWDTVALALGDRPLVAFDLPGHGHSGKRSDGDYWPVRNAEILAGAISELAPQAAGVIGMSLGGLTGIRLASVHPHLVRRLVVVDVTPSVTLAKSAPIAAFVNGPESFPSFEEILERTVRHNPTRSVSSLRRGILHNAHPLPDGRWAWRYDRLAPPGPGGMLDFEPLWDDVSALPAPAMLVLGSTSGVVTEDDVAEFRRRQPTTRVETVAGAGHSVQGDRPVELAHLLSDFVFGTADDDR